MPGDSCDDLARIRLVEELVVIAEQVDIVHAKNSGRGAQFRFADPAQLRRSGMESVASRMAAVAATLAECGRQQRHLDAFSRVLRQRSARTQTLVVGVGEDGHQPPH
jgi:hypothetical protein